MRFDGEIKKLKPIDMSRISQWVLNKTSEHWSEITFRQREFATHSHTESIFLVYNEKGITKRDNSFLTKFNTILSPIREDVSYAVGDNNISLKRMIVVNLKKYGFIRRHLDTGQFLEHHWRCHFPLITNPNVLFHVGNSTVNMLTNHGYIINNQLPHGVSNNSSHDRYHLIMDFG